MTVYELEILIAERRKEMFDWANKRRLANRLQVASDGVPGPNGIARLIAARFINLKGLVQGNINSVPEPQIPAVACCEA